MDRVGPRLLRAQRDARLSLRSTRAESENLRDIALDSGIAELISLRQDEDDDDIAVVRDETSAQRDH